MRNSIGGYAELVGREVSVWVGTAGLVGGKVHE